MGRPGVDAHAKHEGESECAVLFTQFLVNEGALVTVTADDTIHLWNIRQKNPRIVQSLKFQRERWVFRLFFMITKIYISMKIPNKRIINLRWGIIRFLLGN